MKFFILRWTHFHNYSRCLRTESRLYDKVILVHCNVTMVPSSVGNILCTCSSLHLVMAFSRSFRVHLMAMTWLVVVGGSSIIGHLGVSSDHLTPARNLLMVFTFTQLEKFSHPTLIDKSVSTKPCLKRVHKCLNKVFSYQFGAWNTLGELYEATLWGFFCFVFYIEATSPSISAVEENAALLFLLWSSRNDLDDILLQQRSDVLIRNLLMCSRFRSIFQLLVMSPMAFMVLFICCVLWMQCLYCL